LAVTLAVAGEIGGEIAKTDQRCDSARWRVLWGRKSPFF
jgi:hypothetical protein